MYNSSKTKFMGLNFIFILLFNLCHSQHNPTHFKSEIDFGNGTVFSTFLDFNSKENKFAITSPQNADVRIFGGKAKLGRALGKSPKKGIIVTISGEIKNDSLIGESKIPMVGKLQFKGKIQKDILSGLFYNTEGIEIGSLNGAVSAENKLDYNYLYPMIMKTVSDNIYSKSALQNKDWKKFEEDLKQLCAKAHDDIELYFGFNILAQKLPFTHLSLLISEEDKNEDAENSNDTSEISSTSKSVFFEEKNSTTAYLKIKNFSTSEKELAIALPKIVENQKYKNLIIDLRDNGGGGISAAFALAKYIVSEDLKVGYFPTNKLAYNGFQQDLFNSLPAFQPKDTEEFGNELRKSAGVQLIFKKPTNQVFTGAIYVLVNGKTGSTCEPIVYALKNSKRATVIGENTYGGMLAASPYTVIGKYRLMIPIADFYTYDGVRLDKVGVAPDVKTKSEDAENKALEIINGK